MTKWIGLGSKSLVVTALLLASSLAEAKMTYEGQITKPDGSPLSGSVDLKIQILAPAPSTCAMYEESFTVTAGSDGYVSVVLGGGTPTLYTGASFNSIFSNKTPFTYTSGPCVAATYTPTSADGRQLQVYARQSGAGSFESFPAVAVESVPYANQASAIDGYSSAELVRVSGGNLAPLSNANYDALLALVAGTSSQYQQYGKLQGAALPTMSNNQVLGWSGGAWVSVDPIAGVQNFAKTALPVCAAGDFLKDNGSGALVCATPANSGGTVTSITAGTGLTGGPITTAGSLSLATVGAGGTGVKLTYDAYGRVTATSALAEADIPTLTTAGKVSGGAINSGTIGGATAINTSGAITTTGNVTAAGVSASSNITATGSIQSNSFVMATAVKILNGANYVGFTAPVLGGNTMYTLPATDGSSGQLLSTNGAGILSWTSGGGGGTVTSLSASAPLSVTTPTTTPSISIAQATASTDGFLSSADWNSFSSKQPSLGYTPANKAGDTMTGFLTLNADPTIALHAATKQYVDARSSNPTGDLVLTPGTGYAVRVNQTSTSVSPTTGALLVSGGVGVSENLSVGGSFSLFGSTSGYSRFLSSPVAPNVTYTLPSTSPFAGAVLGSDAGGVMSWVPVIASSVSASPGAVASPSISFSGDTDTGVYSAAADVLGFSVGGQPKMTIGPGDVGLTSIASPQKMSFRRANGSSGAPTQVNSSDPIGVLSFQGYESSTTYQEGAVIGAIATQPWGGGGRGTALTFATTANGLTTPSEAMRVSDSGNVGIGTSFPSDALDIFRSGASSIIRVSTTAAIYGASTRYSQPGSVGIVGMRPSTSELEIVAQNNFPVVIGSNSADVLKVEQTLVTVGAAGAADLQINGGLKVGNAITGGQPISNMRICSAAAVGGGAVNTTTPLTFAVPCTGAAIGSVVNCSPDANPGPTVAWSAFVSTAGSITVKLVITGTGSATAANWKCVVMN